MATYTTLYDLAYNSPYPANTLFTPLMKKITVAVSVAALAILNEDVATTNHAHRFQWAQNALRDARAAGQQMLWAVLQQSGISEAGDAALDADVQTAVNGLVNTFAV